MRRQQTPGCFGSLFRRILCASAFARTAPNGTRAAPAGERPKTGSLFNRVLCAGTIARGAITSVRAVMAIAQPQNNAARERLIAAGFPFRYDVNANPVHSLLVVVGEGHEPPQGFIPLGSAYGVAISIFGRQGELIASGGSGWCSSASAAKDSAGASVYPQIEGLLQGV